MTKKSFLTAIAALVFVGANATPLTPAQALDRVGTTDAGRRIKTAVEPQLAFTATDATGNAAVYVFNRGDNGGIILVSADDVAVPLLGYTDDGTFDAGNVPPAVSYWIGEYARQIEYGKTIATERRNIKMNTAFPSSWTPIFPLMTTKWNQNAPYNNMTPPINNGQSPTGCVATAIAQVMKYWNYPEIGTGSIAYNSIFQGQTQRLSMSFNREKFQWDQMLDQYPEGQYTEEQANAVAYLMKAVGYSCQMQYGVSVSGTQTPLALAAMVKYFSYDSNMQFSQRLAYTDLEWCTLIYEQLKNVGPVIYSGTAYGSGGHCFVCDGYDGNGYFHINWGWGGMCDGYYLLTALNPSQQGIGGAIGGFNSGQGIGYNIKKPEGAQNTPKGDLTIMGSLMTEQVSNNLRFKVVDYDTPGFSNLSIASVTFTMGVEYTPVDGGEPTYFKCSYPTTAQTVDIGYYIPSSMFIPISSMPSSLADGKYKMALVYQRAESSNWEHFICPLGCYDYSYLTKSGSSYSIENISGIQMTMSDAEIVSPLYFSNPCEIKFTVSNPSDQPITQGIRPSLLIDGKPNYEADTQLVALDPGETKTVTLTFSFQRVDGGQTPSSASPLEVQLSAYNFITGHTFGKFGTYQMYRASANSKLSLNSIKISNAQEVVEGVGGEIFGISNPSNIGVDVEVSLKDKNAFIAAPFTAVVSENNEDNSRALAVFEKNFENLLFISTGETKNVSTTLRFPDFDPSKIYTLDIYYLNGMTNTLLGNVMFGADSGVESLLAVESALSLTFDGINVAATSVNGVEAIEVYDVRGVKVGAAKFQATTTAELNMSDLIAGLYIVKATASDGKIQTLKVRK